MAFSVLFSGAGLFLAGLALHVKVWNTNRPRRPVLGLLSVFLPPWLLFSLVLLAFGRIGGLVRSDLPAVSLLFGALCAAYMQTYPALQALSPSLVIILRVGRAMPAGLSRERILAAFSGSASSSLLSDRIDDLLAAGMLAKDSQGRLRSTSSTDAFVQPFAAFRALLGLGAGGG